MAKKTTFGSTKRFGPRYGRKLKERFGAIEKEQRRKHKCPHCNYIQVRRISLGIWECNKCGVKFTSRAYTVAKVPIIKMEAEEI
jgi:large subunit ribosomal protein L37Ae